MNKITRREPAPTSAEDRLSMVLEASDLGLWDWNVATGALTWSPLLGQVLGLPSGEQQTYERYARTIHPEDRARVEALVQHALERRGGGVFRAEYRIVRPTDGAERWMASQGRAYFGKSGRVTRMLGTVRDITEQKRLEEEVRTSEFRFRTALDHMPEAFAIYDRERRYEFLNRAGVSLTGKTLEQIVGKRDEELFPAQLTQGYLPHLRRAYETGEDQEFELSMKPAVGPAFKKICTHVVVKDRTGGIRQVLWLTYDLTVRDELQAAGRRKDEFIAMLAHELRNPLAPLRFGLHILKTADHDRRTLAETRAMMERQLSHMVRLIDDLLDVSRISRNKLDLRKTRVTLAEVMNIALETARPLIEASGHNLSVSLPARPIPLDADLTRLAQVFSNLLANSAKFTDRGGQIWLEARRQGGDVQVAIRDTGVGIPREDLSRIFEMFSQVDRGGARPAVGLGIGLALVKGLVEAHGGTVTAASEGPGTGSTFTVQLPAAQPRARQRPTAPLENGTRARSGLRILVVDDHQDVAESMQTMLTLMGNEVKTAPDGLEGVKLAQRFRPELIFMDLGMPRLNGLDATRRIRSKPWGRDMTIVALSGWGQPADRVMSKKAGCDSHLVKPVDPTVLGAFLKGLGRLGSPPSIGKRGGRRNGVSAHAHKA